MTKLDKVVRVLIIAFCSLYLINFFFKPPYVGFVANIILGVFFALVIPNIPKINRRVCLCFFIPGVILFVTSGTSIYDMIMALGRNSGLVILLVSVPIMTMPFFYDTYQEEMGNIAKHYFTTMFPFLIFVLFAGYFLSLIIAMSCLLILYDLFGKNARDYNIQLPFRMALMQGYAVAGLWGPGWATTPIISDRLQIPWLEIVLPGSIFSVFALIFSAFLLWYTLSSNPDKYPLLKPDKTIVVNWRKVATLFLLTGILISLLLFANYLTGWVMFVIVPLAAFPFAISSALIQDKMPTFKKNLTDFFNGKITRGKPEICLFIVGGFLGTAFEYSKVANTLLALLPQEVFVFPLLSSALIMFIIVILALVGVHPVVVSPSLAMAITAESIGLSTLGFAMTLASGWILAVNISPFSSQTMIVAGIEQKTPWEAGPYTNWRFDFGMIPIFAVLVYIMEKIKT